MAHTILHVQKIIIFIFMVAYLLFSTRILSFIVQVLLVDIQQIVQVLLVDIQ